MDNMGEDICDLNMEVEAKSSVCEMLHYFECAPLLNCLSLGKQNLGFRFDIFRK